MSTSNITTITFTVAHCQFRNNSARGQGGALRIDVFYWSHVSASHRTIKTITMVTQCEIINNTATGNGGGIYTYMQSLRTLISPQ